MKRLRLVFPGILLLVLASFTAGAQVPNELYMQGVFLQSDGITPVPPGPRQVNWAISGAQNLQGTTTVVVGAYGVADLTISSPQLPLIFQNGANAQFELGGPQQTFVTAPYAFQSANLPQASGNFTVAGNLTVSNNAHLMALTATNGGNLAVPITVTGNAVFTNVAGVLFSQNLSVAGDMDVDGAAEGNYQTHFTNASVTSLFYGNTNTVILSNATVQSAFTLFTNNYQATANSGTAPCDGFLMVWVKVTGHKTSGANVQIGNLTFKIQYYADACQASQTLKIYTGSTYPVPQGTSWSVALVNASDSGSLAITCYWVPLRGNG